MSCCWRLVLALDVAGAFQALGARDRRHDGGEIGELLGLERHELVAGLGGLQRAGGRLARRDQRIDLGARAVEILHHAGLHAHGVLEAGERVLPAGLRIGEELLRGGRARIGLRIGLRERLIDRGDVVGDALRLGEKLLGLADRLLEAAPATEYGRLARFRAWLISMWPGSPGSGSRC